MGETFWQRLVRGVRHVRQQPHWADFAGADWIDGIMDVEVLDRFHAKQGRTIARWSLQGPDRRLVVYLKRHYRLARWRGWLALFCPGRAWSPAMQEFEHLEWARAEGLPVPVAAAGGEIIGPWGRLQSFLAVEELTDMLPLHQAIPLAHRTLEAREFRVWKRGLIERMAVLTAALHRKAWFHKDLYLCHFYIAEEDTQRSVPSWHDRVRLIDLHRLSHHPWTWPWWRAKDLAQLLYSSHVAGVTVSDRVYFWRRYLAECSPGPRMASWLGWSAQVKAWNYQRHSRKRRKLV